MIDHRHEKVEEQLAAVFHFVLHCAAALEGVASTDDKGQVMRSQLGVAVGSIGVCKASRCKDGGTLDAGLKTLLAKCKLLQFL